MRLRAENDIHLSRYLLLGAAALILVLTLSPLEIASTPLNARWRDTLAWRVEGGWFEALAHLAAFTWLGILLGRVVPGLRRGIKILVTFCLLLEAAQLFAAERHAQVTDVLFNAGGSCLGCWLFSRRKFTDALLTSRIPVLKASVVSALTIWLIASLAPVLALSLRFWDKESRVAVGNELDNSEPWMGTVSRLSIIPGTGAPPGAESSRDSGLIYDFTRSPDHGVRSEGSLRSSELDLVVPAAYLSARNGMSLTNGPLLSAGSAARLSEAILSSGSFVVIAELASVDPGTNFGRLVSLSSSVSARNFMLGREGSDLVFRVRDGLMEENATRNILIARQALDSTAQRIGASYDHGTAAAYKNGALLKRIDLRQPTVFLRLGNGSSGAVSAGILLGVFAAFPAYCLLPSSPLLSHIWALGGTALFSLGPYLAVCHSLGGPAGLPFSCILLVAIGLAYLVAHSFCLNKVEALLQSGPRGGGSRCGS